MDAVDDLGKTALMKASSIGNIYVVNALLQASADTNLRDSEGNTALHRAARAGHASIVEHLLREKANVHVVNHLGQCAVLLASLSLKLEVCLNYYICFWRFRCFKFNFRLLCRLSRSF